MALLDFTVDSSIEELESIADQVDSLAARRGWSQKAVFALQVALDEWVSNVLKYSYDNANQTPIRVIIDEKDGELVAKVIDFGAPFDPTTAVVPGSLDDTLSGKREGGMGLFVMHHLLCGMNFERANNQNTVTMRVKL